MLTRIPDYQSHVPTISGWQQPPAAGGSSSTPMKLMFRWKWRILGFSVLVTLAAGIIIWHLTPRYSAESTVMIDVRQMHVINTDGLMAAPMLDESLVRSDMETFGSLELARSVVNTLNLNKTPEFCGAKDTTVCDAPVDDVAKKLLSAVTTTNDGRSYIIRIRAEAADGGVAAAIANAYANAFVAHRQKMRTDMAQKAAAWLSSYVAQLRQQSVDADMAVSHYRNDHHLIPLRGETTAAQSVSAINGELAALDNDIAQKQSVVDQVQSMQHSSDAASIAPLLNSQLVASLIDREAGLANNEADLRSQLGTAHPQVIAAQARVTQMRAQVGAEVSKAASGLNRELAALNQRKAMLTSQMNAAQASVGQQGTDDVGLQSLESNAASARNVYQNATTRLREIEGEEGMTQSDATVTSEAIIPDKPDYPHKAVMLVGSLLGSLGLGTMAAFGAGLLSGGFRDAEHLEEETGLRMLGVFPRPSRGTLPEDIASGTPLSVDGESLHSVLINLMGAVPTPRDGMGKIILITSAIPGEGKTSFSVALGRSAMRSDLSTILMDCDLRKPSVESLLRDAKQAEPSQDLSFAHNGSHQTRSLIVDRSSGLHVVPMKTKHTVNQMLSASVIRGMLQQLRLDYDLILLDLPPVLAVADALTLAPMADAVVLLVDTHRTSRKAFAEAIQMLQRNGAYIAGTVFSKGELQKYARAYGGYGYLLSDLRPQPAATADG
jgi:succinoglycan biosynthesis transport protein ExoP